MKSFLARSTVAALGVLCLVGSARGQAPGYSTPTLLPLPDAAPRATAGGYFTGRTARLVNANEPESVPAPQPVPMPAGEDTGYQGSASEQGPMLGGCSGGSCGMGDDANGWDGGWAGGCRRCATNCFGPYGCGSAWFGGAEGLVMTRNNPNKHWTSYQSNVNTNQLMHTVDANSNWAGGAGASFGRWFCPDCNGWRRGMEAVYYGTGQMTGNSSVVASNPVAGNTGSWISSTMNLDNQSGPIQFPNGRNVDAYFDNAYEHRISRTNQFQNVELNFLNQYWNCGSRCTFTCLAGVRWFNFNDDLTWCSVAGASATGGPGTSYFGNNGGVDEAHMQWKTTNNLIGFQLGGRADYYVTPCFSLFAAPKFGIYNNHQTLNSRVYTGDGYELFNYSNNTNSLSFLGSIDVGTAWNVGQHWRFNIGYRAVAVTCVALADNQIPAYLAATDELRDIDRNGCLIVHGAFAGGQFCW